jgi:hypothetical protein
VVVRVSLAVIDSVASSSVYSSAFARQLHKTGDVQKKLGRSSISMTVDI